MRYITGGLLVFVIILGMLLSSSDVGAKRKPRPTPTPTPTATPSITLSPTPSPTASPTPSVTPSTTPSPTPPPSGRTFYISPTGLDTNAGTQASPWKTILKASTSRLPGDLILVRGGTYSGQGGYNWKSSGTAISPIAIRAFPGEEPLFTGSGWSHGLIISGYNYVIIDNLDFTGYGMGPSGDAAILLLNARGITIENSRFIDNGSGFQQDHHIYVNSGCYDVVIRRNYMDGTPGAAVHIYHDTGPVNTLIEDNTMRNGYWGVVIGSNANGVRIDRSTFFGNNVNIANQRGTNVTVNGVPLSTGGSQ